jgi:phosphatidylglycerophosphate synthase
MRLILWMVTLGRVFLIPVFLYLAATAQELARAGLDPYRFRWAAVAAMIAIGVSDVLDGWIARRFDLMTDRGSMADSVADKLAQVALVTFFALSVGPVFTPLPFWFLIVVFGRDLVLIVGVLMLRARYGSLTVRHRLHGRVTSILFVAVLLWSALRLPPAGVVPLAILTAGLSVVSGTLYALDGARQGRVQADARRVTTASL